VAAGGVAVPIGISRQLIGEQAFGGSGYQYCGNILMAGGNPDEDGLIENACRLGRVVAEEFGLVGVNGVDFIARGRDAYAIEVNPRWSASMELVERAYGLSVFGAHAAACADGLLPAFDVVAAQRAARVFGKAVIFARRDVVVGDTRAWLAPTAVPAGPARPARPARPDIEAEIRDVPHPGERIAAGGPVCTVLASGSDSASCHAALVQHAERVYAELAVWEREVA
jgi:predicted ATP-grasp superfamily ATP-dependent carboligase